MAEGGKPIEPEGGKPLEPEDGKTWKEEMEEVDSLHLLFARDLVAYVMRRRIPGWSFSTEYATPCPVTPFSYRIRYALDFYLNKECLNLDGLFYMTFEKEPFNLSGFTRVIKFAVYSVFKNSNSYNDLLRFLFLFAHFTVMAFERGVELAPYSALFNMKEQLRVFTKRKGVDSEDFYGELGFKAQELIHEDVPIIFHDYSRRKPLKFGGGKTWKEEMEAVDSLHLLFARDLVAYVMRRRIPGWSFTTEYATPCPVTPFSYRIRYALDFYLNKEFLNFNTLFYMAFKKEPLDLDGYTRVIKVVVQTVFKNSNSYNDLLRFLFLFAHYTVMAFERGVELAPYFALFNMKEQLRVFTKRKGVDSEDFYGELGFKARELIHENTPINFQDFYR